MNLETTNFAGIRFDIEKIFKVSYLTEKMLLDDHFHPNILKSV